jgi:hypothetical protein
MHLLAPAMRLRARQATHHKQSLLSDRRFGY